MADAKISALPASTTPLAGTEVLPIVQGGVTKQVSVANLTAGRAVSSAGGTFTDNMTQGVAAKGVNFTANASAAGKTSQLLNWYEEGTFTPSWTSLTTVGTLTTVGKYTRIGNIVHVSITVKAATSTVSTANTTYFSGLPYSVGYASTVSTVQNWNIGTPGNGLIDTSGNIYTPTWSSGAGQTVTISGFYQVA